MAKPKNFALVRIYPLKLLVLILLSGAVFYPQNSYPQSQFLAEITSRTIQRASIPMALKSPDSVLKKAFGQLFLASIASTEPALRGEANTLTNTLVLESSADNLMNLAARLKMKMALSPEARRSDFKLTNRELIDQMIYSINGFAQIGYENDRAAGAVLNYALSLEFIIESFVNVISGFLKADLGDFPKDLVPNLVAAHRLFIINLDRITARFSGVEQGATTAMQNGFDARELNSLFALAMSDPSALGLMNFHDRFTRIKTLLDSVEIIDSVLFAHSDVRFDVIKSFFVKLLQLRKRLGIIDNGNARGFRFLTDGFSREEFQAIVDNTINMDPMDLIHYIDDNVLLPADF